MTASGGAIVLDLVGKEDLALGRGVFQQVHPGGGTQIASRINLVTFAVVDVSAFNIIPALPALSSFNFSVPCPGASLGDQAMVSFSGSTSGTSPVMMTAVVSANDTVNVCCFAPLGCIQLSGTFRVTVFSR